MRIRLSEKIFTGIALKSLQKLESPYIADGAMNTIKIILLELPGFKLFSAAIVASGVVEVVSL